MFISNLLCVVSLSAEPENPGNWIDAVERALHLIFGEHIPATVTRGLGYGLLFALALLACWGLLVVVGKIADVWKEKIAPLLYNLEERRKRDRRRRFADHVDAEIRRLNTFEQWSDHRFAELEAEVESEGIRSSFIPLLSRRTGIRREKTLSDALETSKERLILLEGAPGAGKSVALRHLAQIMARRAMASRRSDAIVPLYINLKEFEVEGDEPPTPDHLRGFVKESINRFNDRDIEVFLEDYFDNGLREGRWLFLFDSFDEIPAVLSSTEGDSVVRSYAELIADFLGGMNTCRGIIASREFRGPGQLGWPKFRILRLSRKRQFELVKKSALPNTVLELFASEIDYANSEVQDMASNPMFLGILCEHLGEGGLFPDNVHSVLERYVTTRMKRDSSRVMRRYGIDTAELRSAAEWLAFSMSAEASIGLNPTRETIRRTLAAQGISVENLSPKLDALEYIKMARSTGSPTPAESRTFTFSHRRFQEYFATCVVLRESWRVSTAKLLTDGRWREAAVVLCQTQRPEQLAPILQEASSELERACLSRSEDNFWLKGTQQVIGILQDGFAARPKLLPETIRGYSDQILGRAFDSGSPVDRKWALELAGAATEQKIA